MRRLAIGVAVVLAVVAGISAASIVSPGTAAGPLPGGREELPSASMRTGEPVKDPEGGPAWAVRVYDGDMSVRCIAAGRTDGRAFGPADASGRIEDTGAIASGTCADPKAEPLQVAVERVADSGGQGPRSVLFGVADATVERVEIVVAGGRQPIALDSSRSFAVVSQGLEAAGSTTVEVTLSDGTKRTYRL